MQTSLAKKIFAVGSSAAMVIAAMPMLASAAVHSAGTNVSSNGTVYFIASNGQKQPYTSAGAFLSYGFNSWDQVVPASAEDLALPTGSFVPPSDGSLINDHGTVYLMVNGMPEGFTSEPNFLGLGYSYKNVLAGDVSFLGKGANISTTAMSHPVGTLVNDHGTVYLMTTTGKMGIPSLSVFNSWGYSFNKVVPANSYDSAVAMSSGIMNARVAGQLNPTGSTGGTVTPPVTGGVNVSVASNTPATGSVAGGAKATLSRFNLTAGPQGSTITSLIATRLGLSSDSDVTNLYLYDDASNTLLAYGSFNQGRVTFTGSPLISVAPNATATVSVRADINTVASGKATAGDTLGYGIASANDVNAGGATVGGTFPANGNLFTVVNVTTLGSLNVTGNTVSANVDPGTQNTNLAYFQMAGTNQPLSVTKIKFTVIGSIAQTDLQNLALYNGNTQVGSTMSLAADKTLTFDLSSSPLVIASGNTINLYVRGNVMGGSTRTFQFSIQRTDDITVTDTTYNTGIVPTLNSGTAPITSTNVTINQGAATMQVTTDSPTGNIPTGSTNVTLGKFNFTATGEDVRVSSLVVSTIQSAGAGSGGSTSDYLKNGKLVDVTGGGSVQIGSTTNLNYDTTSANGTKTTTFTVPGYWTIPAGTTRTLAVVADTTAGTASNTTLNTETIAVQLGTVTAQGASSLSTVTFGTATGRTLTLAAGSLTAALNTALANTTVVKGQTAVKVASFQLTAGSSEGANITTIQLTEGNASNATDFQNLKVMVGSQQIGNIQATLASNGSTAYSFSPTGTLTIPAGGSIIVDAYADVLTGAATATDATFNLTSVTATGLVDNQSLTVTGTPVTGQTVTISAHGNLTVAADSQAPTTSQLQELPMGTPGVTFGVFNLAADNVENINITKVVVSDLLGTASTHGDLQNFKLYVNGTQVGPTVPSETVVDTTHGTITFNMQSAPFSVPQNTNVSMYVKADVSPYPVAGSGDAHTLSLASGNVTSLGAVSGTSGGTSAVVAGVLGKVYRTALTIAADATSPSGLSSASATQTVAVFNLTNATNSANAQALILPTSASIDSKLDFVISSTLPIPASTGRTLTVYKSTDLTSPVLQATLTTGGTVAGNWNGTFEFENNDGTKTATFTPTGTNNVGTGAATVKSAGSVTILPQTINAGQTVQYVVKFDTTDRSATGQTFTLSIPTQSSNNMWADGATAAADAVTTINGLPVTFGTLQY